MADPAIDTLVIGAGISGLAFAYERLRVAPGENLLVLEGSERAGGLVRTVEHEGFRCEEGPEALPSAARSVRELCQELDLAVHEAPPAAAKRYLALDGKLVEVPASPEDLATSRVLSFGAKLRLMAEATCARDEALDGSIADFARHRFGKEALERVVEPLVAGIHAGDPEELSLRACFPEVVRMVEEHGSITAALKARVQPKKPGQKSAALGGNLIKPVGGMESLTMALARALGVRLCTGASVRSIECVPAGYRVHAAADVVHSARRLVLAVPLAAARGLLSACAPAAAAALATMRAENLVSVAHAYRRADVAHALDGFGYLTQKSAGGLGGLVLGTLFSSTIDPSAAPAGHVLLRSLLGGSRRADAPALTDAALSEHVTRECGGLLGLARPPLFTRVARYAAAIPRFDLEHLTRRARLAEALPQTLVVLGNFTRALGLESLVSEARTRARGL